MLLASSGGQTIAQSLLAACHTVPDNYPVHSLHSYFILAGSCEKSILFDVERVRDGGSFMTRAVKAKQDNHTICLTQASFHKPEFGMEFEVSLQDRLRQLGVEEPLPPPEHFADRTTEDVSLNVRRHTIVEGKEWKLSYVRLAARGLIKRGDWKTNCSMLTFMSDAGMVGTARRAHGDDVSWSMCVSLDHTVHFHRPAEICVEEWSVVLHQTSISSGGRGFANAQAFGLDGQLLATFNQEALIRPMAEPAKL
mmetsp:Transcript_7154/g.16708  ORF Transcript_7154/g.16708 Transcript_7154/m.16708 type:complete len:252 (+) Transcript_7154:116-871(+)